MNPPEIKTFPRIPTKIKGLDIVLGGGFLRGGIYLVMGPPGSGKTIFSNQFGFNYVANGGRALYVSLLSESHSRLFGHLKPMRFFREEAISESFNYVSAYHVLEKDGLEGLLRSIAQTVRQYKATLLFIDGVASAEELANSPVSFKKFVHDLNTVLATSGCTALLLSSLNHMTHPEHTMVDGIISLTVDDAHMRAVREIQVPKLRGTRQLPGRHVFTISEEGITVFPRIESYLGSQASHKEEKDTLLSTGVSGLDKMFGGGLVKGSMTSIIGAAGTGKTLLGTQFLAAGAANGEKGLYFGFYETPQRLVRKAEKAHTAIRKYADKGMIEFVWQPPLEHLIDELTERLLSTLEKTGAQRLFIDGILGLQAGLKDECRLFPAFTALANELRFRGITTIFTEETKLFPREVQTPISDHSAITDNIIYMRHVDLDAELVRFISVIKSRETCAAKRIHRFEISPEGGINVDGVFHDVEALFTGTPRKRPPVTNTRSKPRQAKRSSGRK